MAYKVTLQKGIAYDSFTTADSKEHKPGERFVVNDEEFNSYGFLFQDAVEEQPKRAETKKPD